MKNLVEMFPYKPSLQYYYNCCCRTLKTDIEIGTFRFFSYGFMPMVYRLIDKNEKTVKYCPHCGEKISFEERLFAKSCVYNKVDYRGIDKGEPIKSLYCNPRDDAWATDQIEEFRK